MTTIPDIDKWDPQSHRTVAAAATKNATHCREMEKHFKPEYVNWSGFMSDEATDKKLRLAKKYGKLAEKNEALAADSLWAASEIETFKKELASLRDRATSVKLKINDDGSVSRTTNQKLSTADSTVLDAMIQQLAAEVTLLLEAATEFDNELANKLAPKPTEPWRQDCFPFPKRKPGDMSPWPSSIDEDELRKLNKTDGYSTTGNITKSFSKIDNSVGEKKSETQPKESKLTVGADLWETSKEAAVAKKSANGETTIGGVKLTGEASVEALSAEANAKLGIENSSLKAGAEAEANLLKAEANGKAKIGNVDVTGKAGASIGANAGANATLGKDGVGVGAEAFAGGKVDGELGANYGGVGVGVNGELSYGLGAKGDVGFTHEDGKWKLHYKLGATLGVGGSIGGNLEIDTKLVEDAAQNIGRAATTVANTASDVATNTANAVGNAATSAANAVGNAATNTVDAVGDVASDVGDAIGDAGKAVGKFFTSW